MKTFRLFIIGWLAMTLTFVSESKANAQVVTNVPCTLFNIETQTRSPSVIFDCGEHGFKVAWGKNALRFARKGHNSLTYETNSAWAEDEVTRINGHNICRWGRCKQ